jgi:hypothetical protein
MCYTFGSWENRGSGVQKTLREQIKQAIDFLSLAEFVMLSDSASLQ